ncbi:hypothetical protein N7532_010238 [Penicillium argentinense]|uniref:S-adenosyl-L-methionine-dependent methyltransferase n=1 Tax=Penicillium argentinense TaxID=1131581 RepID=A0A9W9EP82_9EURO|nr:uncharacterized protein N7532_010238 [Penicillium argentinense]KAJ5085467.1 hypothetical protein N7532_010238 [Penicillium argentinense]
MHSDTLRFDLEKIPGTDMALTEPFVSSCYSTSDTTASSASPQTSGSATAPSAKESLQFLDTSEKCRCFGVEGPRPEEVPSSPSPLVLQPVQPPDGEGLVGEEDSTLSPSLGLLLESFLGDGPNEGNKFAHLHTSTLDHVSAVMPGDTVPEHISFPQLASIPEELAEDDTTRETSIETTLPPISQITSDIPNANFAPEAPVLWIAPTVQTASLEPAITSTLQPQYASITSIFTQPEEQYGQSQGPESNEHNTEDTGDTSSTASNGENSSVFEEDYHSDTSIYTASLLSDVKDYCYENGRRYHSYREGHYVLPNDEAEQDRQDLLHHVRNLVLNGSLFRAPVGQNMQRVLDIGTGTGIWAIDLADSYPSAEVIGTDLSPIQPSWVPPNLRFIVDDAESPWLFSASRPFDFIHARDLGGAIADWSRLLQQAYRHLRPGGWIELQEFEVTLRSDDESLRLAPTLCEFLGRLHAASEAFHRPMNIAEGHRQRLIEAGFEAVRDEVYKVPSNAWHEDPVQKQIGRYNLCSLLMAVEAYSLALFTRVLGWSNNETQVFLAGVRRDLRNPDVHTYCNLHVVYGRRPW